MHWSGIALWIDATPVALWIGVVLLYYAALFIDAGAGHGFGMSCGLGSM